MKKVTIRTSIYNLRPLTQPLIATDSNDDAITLRSGEEVLVRYNLMLKVNAALLKAQKEAESIVRENGTKAYIGGLSRDNSLMTIPINDIVLGQIADSLQCAATGDEVVSYLGNAPVDITVSFVNAGDTFTNRDENRDEFEDQYTKDHVRIDSIVLAINDDDRDDIADRIIGNRARVHTVKAPIKRVRFSNEPIVKKTDNGNPTPNPDQFDEVAFRKTLAPGMKPAAIAAAVKKAKEAHELASTVKIS